MPKVMVSLPADLLEDLDQEASRRGSSRSALLAVAARRELQQSDPAEVEAADDLLLFHAGTALKDGRLVSSGGRVLAVTALAPTVAQAAERSRWGAEQIRFGGRHFRRDIGWREIGRKGV